MKTRILGIDEVGRGPWAGPLVVGAVVLGDAEVEGLADSKKLTARRREELAEKIYISGAAVGLGWVAAGELDEIGLGEALKLATRRAVKEVRASYSEIIIDGTVNLLKGTALEKYVTTLAKGDSLVKEISAASIVAKVARDRYMVGLADRYPEYGFEGHVGYGTAGHRAALEKYGITPEHRKSFRPVAKIAGICGNLAQTHECLGPDVNQERKHIFLSSSPIEKGFSTEAKPQLKTDYCLNTTTRIGDYAEEKVARYLEGLGHEVVERNWKTRFCEIDIVSRCGEHLYFTEVKYRRDAGRGDPVEAVTVGKRRKMGFAAESYVKWAGVEDLSPVLAVGSVSGEDFVVDDWFVVAD